MSTLGSDVVMLAGRPGFRRISTGNPQADEILGGGFPANSINIIMGQPGVGKTIFAEQLVFHNTSGDRPILYLTTLSEPLPKVVRYLQGFRFFDESRLVFDESAPGPVVLYEEVGDALAAEGIGALVRRVKEAIKTVSPSIIVIDSFKAVHDLATSPLEMRHMIYELAGLLTAYDTTAFLVGEYGDDALQRYPEFVVADAIVELVRHKLGMRDERYFRVLKLRGSGFREGLHAFRITEDGLQIYPRLVSPRRADDYVLEDERVLTGVPGLDPLLGGGIWRGSTTLVAGPVGSGKTTIGLQFALNGVASGEPALYVHLQENPTQVARLLRAFGTDEANLRAAGLHLLYASPVELPIDSIVVETFRLIERTGVRRVVVDSVGDLAKAATDPERLYDYVYAFSQHLAARNITAFLTYESTSAGEGGLLGGQTRISSMSDNVLLLGIEVEPAARRTIRVLKERASAHDQEVHELMIRGDGVHVV
ncbi:MAG TPA: ATPase domain-containing protein [Longimicrobiales bacterium]